LNITAQESEEAPREQVDFIEARLEEDVDVQRVGRRYGRNERWEALRQMYERWRADGHLNGRSLSLFWERVWPLIGATVVVAVWLKLGKPFPASPDGLFGAAATVSSIFASFLGVAKALILTIKGTETYKVLVQRGYTAELFAYLRDGIFASVFFASCSILGFFVSHETIVWNQPLFILFEPVWVFAGALSLLTYLRITNILFKLLKLA
jgi:hypothetical protein